jgi:transposase
MIRVPPAPEGFRKRSPAELRKAHAEYLADEGLDIETVAAGFAMSRSWIWKQWDGLGLIVSEHRRRTKRHSPLTRRQAIDGWARYPAESAEAIAADLGQRADSLRRLWRQMDYDVAGALAAHRAELGLTAQLRALAATGLTIKEAGRRLGLNEKAAEMRLYREKKKRKPNAKRKLTDELATEFHATYSADPGLTLEAVAGAAGVNGQSLSRRWKRMGLPTAQDIRGHNAANREKRRAAIVARARAYTGQRAIQAERAMASAAAAAWERFPAVSTSALAAEIGCSRSSLSARWIEAGHDPKAIYEAHLEAQTAAKRARAIELRRSGLSARQVAVELGVSATTVYGWLPGRPRA